MTAPRAKAKATYTITYTNSTCEDLTDDFVLLKVESLTYKDAMTIIGNISNYFGGVVVTVDEDEEKPKKKKKVLRRSQRPKK